jgi:ankyrin repeat protein
LIYETVDLISSIQQTSLVYPHALTPLPFPLQQYLEALSNTLASNLPIRVLLYYLDLPCGDVLHSAILDVWSEAQILIEWTPNHQYLAALIAASSLGDIPMIEYLLPYTSMIAQPSKLFGCPLKAATQTRKPSAVAILLSNRRFHGSIYMPGHALSRAVKHKNWEIVKLFVSSFSKEEKELRQELCEVAFDGCIRGRRTWFFEFLLDRLPEYVPMPFNQKNYQLAARSDFTPFLTRALLCPSFDINLNFTPHNVRKPDVIREAARSGSVSFLKLLLDSGIRRGFKDDFDFLSRALVVAAEFGRNPIVKLLLDSGADMNYTTESKYVGHQSLGVTRASPLEMAVEKGELETVRLLIERGADVNAHGRGNQILCIACKAGFNPIVRLLVENGVSPDAPWPFPTKRRPRAYIPMVSAYAHGHSMTATLLRELGALDIRPRILEEGSKEVRALKGEL